MSYRLRQTVRTLAIGACCIGATARPLPALALQVASTRDTLTPFVGLRDSLPAMLARLASVFDSGFSAPERSLVVRELDAIRPAPGAGRVAIPPYRRYALHVRHLGHARSVDLSTYWWGDRAVAFQVRTSDTLLLDAVDAAFREARAAVLLPPGRVGLHLEDPELWTSSDAAFGVVVNRVEPHECGTHALESHGESHGDTLAIHVAGVPAAGNCRFPNQRPLQRRHWHAATLGRHLLAVDYRGDTNLFAMQVTDTSLALSTVRASFVTPDERIRWRVPSGSFTIACTGDDLERRAACDALLGLVDRRADVRPLTFDPSGVSPLRDGTRAYRLAGDRAVTSLRSCVRTAAAAFGSKGSVELRVRLQSGQWIVDRYYPSLRVPVAPGDSACVLPSTYVDRRGALAEYLADCAAPTTAIRRVVASVLARTEGTPEWFRSHGQSVPTAGTMTALAGPRDVDFCRRADSASMRHPVLVFRAGGYFVATTPDAARSDFAADGPYPTYLVWVLDSAGTVVHVPGYRPLPIYDVGRLAGRTTRRPTPPPQPPAHRDSIADPTRIVPQDVRVVSTRAGVVLQWTRPPRWPDRYTLQRAGDVGSFAAVDVTVPAGALVGVDTSARPATSYRYRLRAGRASGDSALSNVVRVTTPVVMAARASWPSEPYMRPAVRGRVLDSLTGRPVANQSLLAATANGVTDSLGRYLLWDLPVGRHEVLFPCPVARWLSGRTLAARTIEVSAATDSVVDFSIAYRRCEEPPKRTWSGEFRGHYESGFESSAFKPCIPFESFVGTAYEGFDGPLAWVGLTSEASEQARRLWPRDTVAREEPRPMFVRWRATIEGPGSYGHMGVSMYRMKVTEVMELRHATGSDCG